MASLSPGATVALGVIVGLLSTCIQSIGLTLQRKSHILEDENTAKRAPYRRRRWQIGMALFLISNIVGASIQITTLPLPLLSTLQASGLVFNAILATIILKEPFTRQTALGTILIAAGAVLISFFSALPEPPHTLDQLLGLLIIPAFVVWMVLTLLFVALVLIATFCLRFLLLNHESPRICLVRGMAYGLVSGILSAHALLLAKSAVELLVRTIADHHNQFDRYQSWLILLAFLVFSLTQLYYLHVGLKIVSTSILYPFVFCMYNIVAILDGLIYFRQMDRLSPLHGILIALGTVILLSGVLALSWRLVDDNKPIIAPPTPLHLEPVRRHRAMTVDMPHSALTPGMGFVTQGPRPTLSDLSFLASPDRDKDDDHDTIDDPIDETSPMLQNRRHTARDAASSDEQARNPGGLFREFRNIWAELRDDHVTHEPHLERTVSAPSTHERPRSAPAHGGSDNRPLTRRPTREKSWIDTLRRGWFGRQRRRRRISGGFQDNET